MKKVKKRRRRNKAGNQNTKRRKRKKRRRKETTVEIQDRGAERKSNFVFNLGKKEITATTEIIKEEMIIIGEIRGKDHMIEGITLDMIALLNIVTAKLNKTLNNYKNYHN